MNRHLNHASRYSRRNLCPAALLAAIGLAAPLALAQTIVDLGRLPGGAWTFASAISDDGTVVVGDGEIAGGSYRAWRWTAATGLVSLGVASGKTYSGSMCVSGNGLVVAGVSGSGYDIASRWTQATGMVSLGSLASGQPSFAFGINADGSVVVGDGYLADGTQRAFRWTSAGGLTPLAQRLPGCDHSLALAISADSSTIAGYCYNNAPSLIYPTACRWLADGTVWSLGTLPGKAVSVPGSISGNGSVIVGYAADGDGQNSRGFRWTAATGMQEIGSIPGALGAVAGSLNSDGSIVTGYYMDTPSTVRALIWSSAHGAQDMEAYLNAQGVSTAGWELGTAGISADGSTLFGWGVHAGQGTTWYISLGCVAPGISSEPSSQSVAEGSPAAFTVQASGTSLQYQWYKGASIILGASGATYAIASVTAQDAGTYRCVLSNSCGTATSRDATLTVSSGCVAPQVTSDPSDTSNCPGGSVTFTVGASGSGTLHYEWHRNGATLSNGQVPGFADISGAGTPTLKLKGVHGADVGLYECEVGNDCGEQTSASGALAVCGADFDCSGFVDTDDFDEFVQAFEAGTDDADFDSSGFVDTDDFDAFVLAFEAGC